MKTYYNNLVAKNGMISFPKIGNKTWLSTLTTSFQFFTAGLRQLYNAKK